MKLFAVLVITTVSKYTIHSNNSDLKQFFCFQNPYTFMGYYAGQCTEHGAAHYQETLSHNPGTGLYSWCSPSQGPSAAGSCRQGWGGLPSMEEPCMSQELSQWHSLCRVTNQLHLWRTAPCPSRDLGSIWGGWPSPEEHSKGGFIMWENRTSLRKGLGLWWQKE